MRKSLALSFLVTSILVFTAFSGNVSSMENRISFDGIEGSSKLMDPDIYIEIDQDELFVDVEPGKDGICEVTGTIYCDMPPTTPPGQQCLVFPIAHASGWAVENPPAIAFTRTYTEESFNIRIQVPPETSAVTPGTFVLSARWRYSPGVEAGDVDPVSINITVNSYCNLVLGSEKPVLKAPVGEWVEFELTLRNDGNVDSNVTLDISSDSDVVVELRSKSLFLLEKNVIIIKIKAKQEGGYGRSNPMTIRATSPYDGDKNDITFGLYLKTTSSMVSLMKSPVLLILFSMILLLSVGISVFIYKKRKMRNIS